MDAARRSKSPNILEKMTAILKFNDALAYGLAAYALQCAIDEGNSVDVQFDHTAQTITVPDNCTGVVRQALVRSKIDEEEYDLEYF